MAKRALTVHSAGPHPDFKIGCKVSSIGRDALKLEYVVIGAIAGLQFPVSALPDRTDGLWNGTCFEAFFRRADGHYIEFNFSPSLAWASYRFESYRSGMAPALDLAAPEIFTELSDSRLALTAIVAFPPGELDELNAAGLSAVIEETDGTKSYWALAHPPGKPDFHAPTCFTLTLPPPSST